MANKSLIIAQQEKEVAIIEKKISNEEVNRARARIRLAQNQEKLAELSLKLKEKNLILIENKIKNMKLLKFLEEQLDKEKRLALYDENIAKAQLKMADIHKKIAGVERIIASLRMKIAGDKIRISNERGKLGKKMLVYVKAVRSGSQEQKIRKLESNYQNQNNILNEAKKKIIDKKEAIKNKQIKLSHLKKELAEIISDRAKIRPISNEKSS